MFASFSPRRRLVVLGAALLAVAVAVAGLVVALWPERQPTPGGPVPVVLVHGYDGTPASFDVLSQRLRAASRQVVVVQLPDRGTGDIETSAGVVARAVDRTHAARVDLVGYSAGGIVVRAYLGEPGRAQHARHVVLLGSPNHGAQLAGLAAMLGPQVCTGACAQLVPGSTLLNHLNQVVRGSEVPRGPDVTSIWTALDQTVTPPTSAVLAGARNVRLQDVCANSRVDHGGLVRDPLSVGLALRALSGTLDGQPGHADCASLRATGSRATASASPRSSAAA
jgi:triacylglycerol esterase/lipase EstA (alpha/beta hydrolase family)